MSSPLDQLADSLLAWLSTQLPHGMTCSVSPLDDDLVVTLSALLSYSQLDQLADQVTPQLCRRFGLQAIPDMGEWSVTMDGRQELDLWFSPAFSA